MASANDMVKPVMERMMGRLGHLMLGAALLAGARPAAARDVEATRRALATPVNPLPPLPPAVLDDSLAIGGDAISGRTVRTRMVVDVQVNGRGPLRFAVDSGADTSVIGEHRARQLALPAASPVLLHGTTASTMVDRVRVDTLDLGPSTIRDLDMPVLRERDLGAEGLIGIDALVEQRLMLDFEAREIRIEDATRPAPRYDGDIVVVARRRRGQLILTQARAEGRSVEAVIDTGSEITIGNLAFRDQLLRRHVTFETIAVTGVTGVTMNLQIGRVEELRLGPILLQNVTVAFADVPPFAAFGLVDKPALLLGTDLMATFRRVSLDFRARKVRFQLRRCGASDFFSNVSSSATVAHLRLSGDAQTACRR